jgi:hypothetical protein
MKVMLFVLSLNALIILSSCKSEEEKIETTPKQGDTFILPPKQEQQQAPIQKQENIAATQAKDKARVLKTIHKDCPQLKSTIQGMDFVFANYDMVFNLEEIEVIELSADDAKVYYKQTTRATRGEGYPPTRATGIHLMKKENGKWKIFKTEYLSSEQIM